MTIDFGSGVTRTLDPSKRQFRNVVWQDASPPLDSELNLTGQIAGDALQEFVRSQVPSGFFTNPLTASDDFRFDPLASNLFYFGNPRSGETQPNVLANVNGWVVPVAGTFSATLENQIRLYPPPETDFRVDFVFLEVWQALVSPNPSTSNKPSASTLYKYGNVEFGGTNLTDDLEDPAVTYETTKRVQLQYRLRVVGSGSGLGTTVSLETYPDGLTDPIVKARGTASVDTVYGFTNMREELGDPSLWRAGNGDPTNTLGTVDGYAYAIPVCAVVRRNSTPYVSFAASGSPNQNGSTDRTPSTAGLSDPRAGAVLLTQASLAGTLSATATGAISITSLSGSGLGDSGLFPVGVTVRYLQVGTGRDMEIIGFSSTNVGGGTITISVRGAGGTRARRHAAGSTVSLYNTHPQGLYADQVNEVIDLRRSIRTGDWDYTQLLHAGVSSLLRGDLSTSPKRSGTGGNTFGTTTTEVSYLSAYSVSTPNHVARVDGPDGIRTVWSDAIAPQSDVSLLLDPQTAVVDGFVSTTFDQNVATQWSVGADFQPDGFMPTGSGAGWKNGSVIRLFLGGVDGAHGAVGGFSQTPNPKDVRFLSPKEMWKQQGLTELQSPWKVRFVGGAGNSGSSGTALNGWKAARITTPAKAGETQTVHPGPMYPREDTNFEKPYLVLGDILSDDLFGLAFMSTSFFFNIVGDNSLEVEVGANFDTAGVYYSKTGSNFDDDVNAITNPLLGGTRTLWSMLTDGGRDLSGQSSEVYLLVYGDSDNAQNNGAFKVIGAGSTAGYTRHGCAASTRVKVQPVSALSGNVWVHNPSKTMTFEFRSQYFLTGMARGGSGGRSDAAIVLTDIQNTIDTTVVNPWSAANTGSLALSTDPILSKMVVDTSLLWGPSRGATLRVAENIQRFSLLSGDTTHLRNQLSDVDATFVSNTGFPTSERHYDPVHVQLWNRLESNGEDAPKASSYGGSIVGSTDVSREHELLVDPGSKTVVFRPFKLHQMTLKGQTTATVDGDSLVGQLVFPGPLSKDGAAIFTGSGAPAMGYAVPPEFMPRFGRQDIPYHVRVNSSDPFLPGINHLFASSTDPTSQVFYIIGGEANTSPSTNAVYPLMLDTSLGYCARGTITGPAQPATGARKTVDVSVVASDSQSLTGIEMPPYIGIARLYGVYERADFVARVTSGHNGAHESDRITPIADPPKNLLRTNAVVNTLFIRENGGFDFTSTEGDHTYVIPVEAIDISLIPTYSGTEVFDDYDYVVEAEVFGFAQGFINRNNFVLARNRTGTGTAVAEGTDPELTQVRMVIPSPATSGDSCYLAYTRTPYQGDPYMTRDGSTIQTSDYSARYGRVPSSDSYYLQFGRTQYDPTTGDMIVDRPNARSLQVLASMDFYTTLGTGKIGGRMFPGTLVDTGSLPRGWNRRAMSLSEPKSTHHPRVFTEGQGRNTQRASLSVLIIDYTLCVDVTDNITLTIVGYDGTRHSFVGGTDFSGASDIAVADSIVAAINSIAEPISSDVYVSAVGARVVFTAKATGSVGTNLRLEIAGSSSLTDAEVRSAVRLMDGNGLGDFPAQGRRMFGTTMAANFFGASDALFNAGVGDSQASLTGLTERLPLGVLLQDSDFVGENPLHDRASSFKAVPASIRPTYKDFPFSLGGAEVTRFLGSPGEEISLCDGAILQYIPYNIAESLGGTRKYRTNRGGATFLISGAYPGGPLDWTSDSFPPTVQPTVKSGILACKALLVRNFKEEAFSGGSPGRTRSQGDEIQMVVLTQGILPSNSEADGVTMSGVISPSGWGEGYAAADRYRLPGLPMAKGTQRTPKDPTMDPLPYLS